VERTGGYGGFGAPTNGEEATREPLRAESRSQTFPLRGINRADETNPGESIPRPSTAGSNRTQPFERPVAASPPRGRRPSVAGPDRSRVPPPRGVSLIGRRNDPRLGDAPPVPLPDLNLAAEFGIGNPYHTPTESQSSNGSGYSVNSKASSQSSPPQSNASPARRKGSNTSNIDVLMNEIQSSIGELQPKELPSSTTPLVTAAPIKEQYAKPMVAPSFKGSLQPLESPMDPAIQNGRLSPLPPRSEARSGSPAPTQLPGLTKTPRRPTTAKGNCKGCREAIKGKSVSSADGRLTGRYHKQCFVCKTCSEPFSTATFYVIDDAPYCERHYHKLNGSMCQTCDRGIEGEYLETERKQKYHPHCLTCTDCRKTLKDDYFEMNGRVYCERDAYKRAQQTRFLGPGTNRMERRTTRLMMM